MKIFSGTDKLPVFHNAAVTVGSFDGVHEGHRQILARVIDEAREGGGESVVVTFSPHPREVLEGPHAVKLLTTPEEKIYFLERAGVDNLVEIAFTPEFSRLSPREFVEGVLAKIGAKTLVVGFNHHFGHNKEGNYGYLSMLQPRYRYDVVVVSRRDVGVEKVSSSIIRDAVSRGDMTAATRLLGHGYPVFARAESPNLFAVEGQSKLLPPAGTYAVEIESGDSRRPATVEVTAGKKLAFAAGQPFGEGAQARIFFMR